MQPISSVKQPQPPARVEIRSIPTPIHLDSPKPVQASTPMPTPIPSPTPIATPQIDSPQASAVVGTEAVKEIIIKWANYYGVSADLLLRIASCESGYQPGIVSTFVVEGVHPTGLFQHLPNYWPARAVRYGVPGASIFDAAAQARVTAGMFHDGQASQWECK